MCTIITVLSLYVEYAVRFPLPDGVKRKIRTHLDLLSIPRLRGKKCQNV